MKTAQYIKIMGYRKHSAKKEVYSNQYLHQEIWKGIK